MNICVRDEQESKAVGDAYVADRLTNSKLKVIFFWPFYGDYWIFDFHQNYEWALVGGRDGKTLWILSREKTMPDVTYSEILEKIKVLGFDPNLLEKNNSKLNYRRMNLKYFHIAFCQNFVKMRFPKFVL